MNLCNLTHLKYQLKPNLIIEECLKSDDPTEEVKDCLMALNVFGLSFLANKVIDLLSSYGLKIDCIVMDTYF